MRVNIYLSHIKVTSVGLLFLIPERMPHLIILYLVFLILKNVDVSLLMKSRSFHASRHKRIERYFERNQLEILTKEIHEMKKRIESIITITLEVIIG